VDIVDDDWMAPIPKYTEGILVGDEKHEMFIAKRASQFVIIRQDIYTREVTRCP